jgi:hypothetical protein
VLTRFLDFVMKDEAVDSLPVEGNRSQVGAPPRTSMQRHPRARVTIDAIAMSLDTEIAKDPFFGKTGRA